MKQWIIIQYKLRQNEREWIVIKKKDIVARQQSIISNEEEKYIYLKIKPHPIFILEYLVHV